MFTVELSQLTLERSIVWNSAITVLPPAQWALKNHSIPHRKCIEFYPRTRGTRVSREQAPKTSTGSCDFGVKMSEDGELNHANETKTRRSIGRRRPIERLCKRIR